MKLDHRSDGRTHLEIEDYEDLLAVRSMPDYRFIDGTTVEVDTDDLQWIGVNAPRSAVTALPAGHLFDYQSWIVRRAFERERFAIFAGTGQGKTAMQLDWARLVLERCGGKVIILAPLNVVRQTIAESERFYGGALPVAELTKRADLDAWLASDATGIGITNYEKFDTSTDHENDELTGNYAREGDQLAIFNKRGDEYPDTIKVFASYPALKLLDAAGQPRTGHSRINTKLLRSDENEWFSTCEKCGGEPYVMHPDHIIAEKGKAEHALMQCPKCKAFLDDAARYRMAHRQGFDNWKPKREFKGIKGFHANAMLWPHPTDPVKMPGGALQMIAQQREDAENSENVKRSMRTFVNMVCGEPFDPADESEIPPDWKVLFNRREDYATVPQAASFLAAFGDVQQNRIEVGWRAFGRNEQSWGMDHVVLDGYVRDREVWCALVRELGRMFPHESGATMTLGFAFVDGGAYSEDVYRFFQYVRAALAPYHPVTNSLANVAAEFFKGIPTETISRVFGHCRASKGVGKHGAPVVAFKMSTVAKNLKGHEIGTWEVKDRIYARLRKTDPNEKGFMHFNKRYSEAYFQQLTVEKVAIEYDGGQEIRKYENPDQARNEALDIEVGCYAALSLRVRNFDSLEAKIAEDAALAQQKAASPAQQQPARPQPAQPPPRSVVQRLRAW